MSWSFEYHPAPAVNRVGITISDIIAEGDTLPPGGVVVDDAAANAIGRALEDWASDAAGMPMMLVGIRHDYAKSDDIAVTP